MHTVEAKKKEFVLGLKTSIHLGKGCFHVQISLHGLLVLVKRTVDNKELNFIDVKEYNLDF